MWKEKAYVIRTIKTEHSISSLGYALVENTRPGRFNRKKAVELGIPPGPLFAELQKGNPVEVDGKLIKPEYIMGPPRPGRTIVYSGDTRPCESMLEASRNADLLIHDCSFADEMAAWAEESRHSTAGEVATLAKEAKVIKLILTHISSRYTDDAEPILIDSKKVFENVIVAEDLMELEVPYRSE